MAEFKPVFINDIVSPKCRLMFVHLAKPDSGGQYSDDKFKATGLFDKDTSLAVLKRAVLDCAQKTWPNRGITKLTDFDHPFRKGNEKAEKGSHWLDTIYIVAKSKRRPTLIDRERNPIDIEEVDNQLYSGCFARMVLTAMSYETFDRRAKETVRGVTFLLELVQKHSDGERIGGGGNAIGSLDAVEDDDFSFSTAAGSGADEDLIGESEPSLDDI